MNYHPPEVEAALREILACPKKRRKYIIPGHYCLIGDDSCHYLDGKTDVDHTKTRGAGGLEILENLAPLCRGHHNEKGNRGIDHMALEYERYLQWLNAMGWKKDPLAGWYLELKH